MRPLRPGWARRWPRGYLGPQGQVIIPVKRGWSISTYHKGQTSLRWAPNLEAAQVTGEQEYAKLVKEAAS